MAEPIIESSASLTSKGNLVFKETTRLRFFGIPWPFTHYQIYENDIVVIKGLLNLNEDDCYLYKIADVNIKRTLYREFSDFQLSPVSLHQMLRAIRLSLRISNTEERSKISFFHSQKPADFVAELLQLRT